MKVRARLVNWVVLLVVMAGLVPWAPGATAQDGTPDDADVVEVVVTEVPAETPTSEPVATESQGLAPNSVLEGGDESLPGSVAVVGITLQCTVATDQVPGTLIVTDPVGAESVSLTLKTTDDPAIPDLQTIVVPVTPGTTSYPFVALLEPGDYEASTTHAAVVTGPGGAPTSVPFDLGVVNGLTVCQPGGVEPSVTETIGAIETATSTATATVTATSTATETASPPVVTTGKVINTGGANLNCRSAASSGASIIAKLAPNSTVPVRGAAANGWVPVTCGSQAGFVSASYLQIITAPGTMVPTATSTVVSTATSGDGAQTATVINTGGAGLRCRTAPNTTATIITVLPEGSNVAARGAASNGWVPVTCGGRDGFVSASYARVSTGTATTPTVTPTSSATATTSPSEGQTAYVTGTGGAGLRCRTEPVSGAVITVLPENTRVTIETQANGWARIQCAGQTGWVSLTYVLFTVNPSAGGGDLRIDVNLRTQYMIVYQGSNVLGRSYVSTGRPGFDTPTGTYYINRKVLVKDMAGVLGGESYHVKDVPHVMYFTNRGHAIHGTYWHNNFGYVMSHGCVNLPQGFASWLYGITPIGTKMTIHY